MRYLDSRNYDSARSVGRGADDRRGGRRYISRRDARRRVVLLGSDVMVLVLLHLGTPALILLPEEHGRVRVLEQHLLLARSHLVDAVISEEHNGARDPEGDARRD